MNATSARGSETGLELAKRSGPRTAPALASAARQPDSGTLAATQPVREPPARLRVFYDGDCPLCRREIGFYRRRAGAERIDWVDASSRSEGALAPGLCRADALARFHVQLPDGRLVGGARGFAHLWAAMPGFRWLGSFALLPGIDTVAEASYRAFLRVRPALQRLARDRQHDSDGVERPRWLVRALRSDHAGETGAVAIYEGILRVARDRELRGFARRHLRSERRHLRLLEDIVPLARRSRLLPVWRMTGFLTGALSALAGPRAVYGTIDAVETFVDRHYRVQLDALAGDARFTALRAVLDDCRRDELAHRDEARAAAGAPGLAMRAWARLVGGVSGAAVALASRV